MRTRRLLALAAAGTAVAAGAAGATTFNGSIGAGDPGHLNFVLDAPPASTCGSTKSTDQSQDNSGPYRYDLYTIPSAGTTCFTIQLSTPLGAGRSYSVAYLNSFNPNSILTNYLGDLGIQGGMQAGLTRSYSVQVPGGNSLVVEVEEYDPGAGVSTYTLDVTGSTPTAVKLVSFHAAAAGRNVIVSWRTADETDTAGFEVFRVTGGKLVRLGGVIPAKRLGHVAGASYSVVDRNAPRRATYRVRAVGLDGSRAWVGLSALAR